MSTSAITVDMTLDKEPIRPTYEEASAITGLPVGTLYALVSRLQIPHYRLGPRLVRFDRRELEQWLRARHVAASEQKQTPAVRK